MKCDYAGICGGCSEIKNPYKEQLERKLEKMKVSFNENEVLLPLKIGVSSFAEGRVRDRVDLSMRRIEDDVRLGLFDVHRNEIVDIYACPQMSESLEAWFLEFRKDLPPVDLASIRLRVSPNGMRGVWLDLPNISVKELLEEGAWLDRLVQKADAVEIGQRRKRLIKKDGTWKLGEPKAEQWFETYLADGIDLKAFPLKVQIGGFSQPGFLANKSMIQTVIGFLKDLNIQCALELCAGSGNLSFAISSLGIEVFSTELDKAAIENAKQSLENSGAKLKVKFEKLNAHKNSEQLKIALKGKQLLVVDPPRSGLKDSLTALEELPQDNLPEYILYVSCFLESLVEDNKRLKSLGYDINKLHLLDQFPHSRHAEYILLLKRI